MPNLVFVTGSDSPVGTALRTRPNPPVRYFDLRRQAQDVSIRETVATAVKGCCDIVHLAVVSQVTWGEHDPALCWELSRLA